MSTTTFSPAVPSASMVAVAEALGLAHAGRVREACALLDAAWAAPGRTPLDSVGLAHTRADLCADPRERLAWDARALAAASDVDDDDLAAAGMAGSARALLPSLHLNLGDAHLQVGDVDAAAVHVDAGLAVVAALAADGVVDGGVDFVAAGLARLAERVRVARERGG